MALILCRSSGTGAIFVNSGYKHLVPPGLFIEDSLKSTLPRKKKYRHNHKTTLSDISILGESRNFL
jgi:hypothetical protein